MHVLDPGILGEEGSHQIELDGDLVEYHVDPALMPGVRRALFGETPHDSQIDALPVPRRPIWLALVIRALRWYRRRIGAHFPNRCVFEPSCSRYSEMAFRKHGPVRGLALTVRRLHRCRPGMGGVDLP